MKRKILLGCLLPLLLVGGLTWYGMRALRGDAPAEERFETARRGDVEIKVTETGAIEAEKKVEVKSKVAGRMKHIYVEEGTPVTAGRLVAEIDPIDINSQVAQMAAQVEGGQARLDQSNRALALQREQTRGSIEQAREALRSAQARLKVAQEQQQAQPALTSSAIAQASASLKAARDNLTMLKESTHPQAVVAAQTGYDDAKAAEETAHSSLQRQQRLLERGFVSQQVVDTARSELASVTARLEQAKKRLDLIEQQNRLEVAAAESRVQQEEAALETARANSAQVAITTHELDAARAAVAQAKSQLAVAEAGRRQDKMREDDVRASQASEVQLQRQLDQVKVQQSDTTLIAPMSGVVTRRYIEEGELVTSGIGSFSNGTPVLQIADLSRMRVRMSVNEVDVHKIRTGLPVEITIDAARSAQFHGTVTRVAPAAIGAANPGQDAQAQQNASGGGVIRFAVEVTFDQPDARLKPGMSAKCAIIIARRKGSVMVPSNCVTNTGGKWLAQVVTDTMVGGKKVARTSPREVKVGLQGDSFVEVLSGLKEGERVKPAAYTGPKRREIDIDMK